MDNIKGPKSYKHRPTNPSVSNLQKQRNKNEYMEISSEESNIS